MAPARARFLVAWIAAFAAPAFGNAAALEPPGFRLGDAATPTAYEVRLGIDPKEPTFTGEARIEFRVNAAAPVVWLHATRLLIESVEVSQEGRPLDVDVVSHGEDNLGLQPKAGFAPGSAVARFRFTGAIELLAQRGLFLREDRGESYVISQHEEISARRTFPCFDEPRWKTPWKITIDAPSTNVVVSNSPETGAADVPGRPGWRRHEFATTKPLPTYLVALAVGPFDVVDGGTAGANRTPLRYLAPKGRGADTRYAREVTPRLLEILEAYFGTPFPFEKLDSVALPETFGFGAMENAGMITYGTPLILARAAQETPLFHRTYVSIAAHEIAHMWFGNMVTPAWWNDIWLNESFASWVGEKTLYRFKPEWDTGDYRARLRAQAIETDRLESARRVRNPVNDRDELAGAFDAITYEKGSAVLEMLEAWIGEERFREGVREYLRRHAWGSATSSDFFRAIGAASGRSAETVAAFESFVDQSGAPLLDVELVCGKGSGVLEVSQHRLRPVGSKAAEREWIVPACFRVDGRTQCEVATSSSLRVELRPNCPAWVLGNARGTGYYVTRYGPFLWQRILRSATALPALEATTLVSDSALLAESGLLPVDAAFNLADATLRNRSPTVQLATVRLLERIPDAWLDPQRLRKKRAVIAQRVQPLARSLGWRERAGESDETTELRVALLAFAARSDGGSALRTQARRLAIAWMRERAAVAPSMAVAVLDTAARFSDRATYELLESLAITTQDGLERRRLQSALAKVRDPALRQRALTVMARNLKGQDLSLFLRDALDDEHNRLAAFEFVRTHFDALTAKMSRHSPGRLASYLRGLCTAQDRDRFVAFFEAKAPQYEGGPRRFAEARETIDLCIAARS